MGVFGRLFKTMAIGVISGGLVILALKYCDEVFDMFDKKCCGGRRGGKILNHDIMKEKEIVVDRVNTEELTQMNTFMCRCWKSKNFPFCDGEHRKHNAETGDNVGPLIIRQPAN